MKKYELEINNVGSDMYMYMSKGHHDIHEFMTAIEIEGTDKGIVNQLSILNIYMLKQHHVTRGNIPAVIIL